MERKRSRRDDVFQSHMSVARELSVEMWTEIDRDRGMQRVMTTENAEKERWTEKHKSQGGGKKRGPGSLAQTQSKSRASPSLY